MKDVSTERWKRIDILVDGALDLPVEERGAYLDRVCGDDPALRKEVDAMLGAGAVAGTFLENQRPELLGDMNDAIRKASEEDDSLTGTHVGPYRLIRPIGHGGMGQVYLAMRDDKSYTRYVAVKVIKRGMDTEEILNRFRMERRILASLAHPNIARLLDGGATQDGLSYFVMEFIEGEPIIEFCDSRKMPVRRRLELFRQVCGAVQFAHQNLVVHRDLKPANILVTPDGQAKLLDFGIAKVINPNLAGYTVPMTQANVRVMTPEYASPEQMRGGTVTTASDVYQLGILLYELLTGSRPHKTEGRSKKEIEELILTAEPARPSTAVSQISAADLNKRTRESSGSIATVASAEYLRKTLSGDLDRIVLMALRKEPDRRYPSADLFQEDIRRYLEGLPVSAQADTLGYRASKFVRRHKVGVASSVALVLLLVAVTLLAVRFALVTSEQSQRIAAAAAKTEQVSVFMTGLFQAANPEIAQGRDISVRELLDAAVDRVERDLAGQPEMQAHMLMEMGIAYREMADFEASQPLLERSLAMRRANPETAPEDLARSEYELGVQYYSQDVWDESETLIKDALAIRQSIYGPDDVTAAGWANDLSALLAYTDRGQEASDLLDASLVVQMAALGDNHPAVVATLSNQAWFLNERGLLEDDRALLEEAESKYRTVLVAQRRLLGADHPDIGVSLNNLGAVQQDLGRFDEAETTHREAYAIRLKVLPAGHPAVASSLNQIARALHAQGKLDQAEVFYRETVASHEVSLGANHRYVGRDLNMLGVVLADKEEFAEAEQALIRAIGIYRITFADAPEHPWIEDAQSALSTVYQKMGKPDRSTLY
ncbi:MAG: serine/threonine protein kinase [Rhodothermales bacterium]|jgi:serine/threonine protein kinase